MTIIGDYKSYKKYEVLYPEWKNKYDLAEAKHIEYLKHNPNDINPDDLQRSHALLRAIDIMDEASQKKASRVADMLAINELSDYRQFADYSRIKAQ